MKEVVYKRYKKIFKGFFDSQKYWEERYANWWNSWEWSYAKMAEYKAQIINDIIKRYKIKSIIELWCWDWNNLQYYDKVNYTWFDISKKAIENCIDRYLEDKNKSFLYYEPKFFKSGWLQKEMVVSLEVIFHLVEDSIYRKYMTDLFNTSSKYVVIFSSNHDNNKNSAIHVKHREFTKDVSKDFKLIRKIETPTVWNKKLFFSDFYLFEKK